MGLQLEKIKINQTVRIVNCEGLEGLTWTVVGFNGNLVCLKNTANSAYYVKAHPSNME